MFARLSCALAVVVCCAATTRSEEPSPKADEARKELELMQGTWELVSQENSKEAKADTKGRTLFVGGNIYLTQLGGKLVQAGQMRLVPSKSPSTIDVIVRKGEHEDNTMLGIYELKNDTLKVCFDPEGEGRPKKFSTKKDSSVFVATYKRVKKPGEDIDISGSYKSETYGPDNKKATMTATVQRHGDAYLMKWEVPNGVAYVGTGIRQGSTLSVAWVNRGSVGVSVYKIEKGKLAGVYTEVGGAGLVAREVLTASKTKWVEVRRR